MRVSAERKSNGRYTEKMFRAKSSQSRDLSCYHAVFAAPNDAPLLLHNCHHIAMASTCRQCVHGEHDVNSFCGRRARFNRCVSKHPLIAAEQLR